MQEAEGSRTDQCQNIMIRLVNLMPQRSFSGDVQLVTRVRVFSNVVGSPM
jgi:hypothetical protein